MDAELKDWLALQCQMIAGAREAMLVLGSSEHAPGAHVVRWSPQPNDPSPRLRASLDAARQRSGTVVQEGRGANALSHVAVPFLRADRVVGVVGVGVAGVTGRELKSVADLLSYGLRSLTFFLEAQDGRERLEDVVAAAGGLLDCGEYAEAAHSLARELALRFDCERVSIGMRKRRRVDVVALSNAVHFERENDAVRAIAMAMEEALDQDALLELPAPPDAPPHALAAHAQLRTTSGAGTVCSVPLASRGMHVGVVACEWRHAEGVDDLAREGLPEVAALCGPILHWMQRADAGPFARAWSSWQRFRERRFGSDPRVARVFLAAIAVLVLGLALIPGTYRVAARATLEGRVQRALVAAVDGYISEASVRAGDLVAEGDVLARLDDRDLRLESQRWGSERSQLEKEYREALAAQDRTQVSILRTRIQKVEAQVALAEEEVARTTVRAPFDGVVVDGNLDQALGSPVTRGDVLFTVAPLDGYRIIVKIDDRDIADVQPGQRGRLALSALPNRPLDLEVERITPVSTIEDGRNYFRVEAVLDAPIDTLRPGMEGIAKIEVGERRLLWIWTHELLDWLRLAAWSFLPW